MDISFRLREIRNAKSWTVADMAERTGIPKRTLDKYMLREGASAPGLDALAALSKGLGVSLDYLVFGEEQNASATSLMVFRCTNDAVMNFVETLYAYHKAGTVLFDGETLLNTPFEGMASHIAGLASEKATSLSKDGVTMEDLLHWQAANKDRFAEVMNDHLDQMLGKENSSS